LLVGLVLIWSESFLPEIFLSRFGVAPFCSFFAAFFYAFVIVFESCLVKNFAFVHFCPSKSPVSRSGTVVTAVTLWTSVTGLDIEFSAKLGSPK